MKSHPLMLSGLLAMGLTWGASPVEAQTLSINLADLIAGRGLNILPDPGHPYADPYRADRPAYPYGPPQYGQPYGGPYQAVPPTSPYGAHQGYIQQPPYDPRAYNRPSLPEEPPYGLYSPQVGYGPPTYRESYRPPFPGPRRGSEPFPGYGPVRGGSTQLMSLADTLAWQVDGFLQAFATTAREVPEGEQFLVDAQALSAAANRFRDLAAGGASPVRLSQELRGVEGAWQQLQQRTQRVARGRTGPNIQQVGLMGNTLQQMWQYLP